MLWRGDMPAQDTERPPWADLEVAVRAGDQEAARRALESGTIAEDGATARFWRAQACLLAGRDEEAARLFDQAAGDVTSPFFRESVLSQGALWARRGETARARKALEAGLESDDMNFLNTVRLRLAEVHLAQGGAAEARTLLKTLPSSLERSALEARAAWMLGQVAEAAQLAGLVAAQAPAGAARDTARLVQARLKASAGQILEADRALLEWVRAEPTTAPLPAVVLALDEFKGLAAEEVNTLFEEWKVDPKSPLAAVAAYGQAAAQASRGESASAALAFDAFATAFPDHPLVGAARARSIELALASDQAALARSWGESWRRSAGTGRLVSESARAAFYSGLAAWQDAAPTAAGAAFRDAATTAPDAAVAAAARINAALSDVEAGQPLTIDSLGNWPDAVRTVRYEAGMFGARHAHPEARSWLEAFLAEATDDDPRVTAAWSALTELDLATEPTPAMTAARQHARAAQRTATTPAWKEQAGWLTMMVEAAAGDWSAALQKSTGFLTDWPQSDRRLAVRFQRAAWFGQLEQWPAAIQEYLTLATEADAQPAFAARAHFLAGLAELRLPSPDSLDRAIDRWREAAAVDESMAFPARYQQALAKSRLGKSDEALLQLDALIAGPPIPTPAQHAAIQLARGELWLIPTATQAERAEESLAALDFVVTQTPDPSPLKSRALYRRGQALQRLGRSDEALDSLTRAAAPLLAPVSDKDTPAVTSPWPARAGLAAVALLEDKKDWEGAANLAQRLAAAPGPHAAVARARASRLRLEHFLWEE